MFVLIANPESPRVRLFQEAVAIEMPGTRVDVVPWLSIARDRVDLREAMPPGALLRIESAGQDAEVERAFLELGYPDRAREHEGHGELLDAPAITKLGDERGRIHAPRQTHLGFLRALAKIELALEARPDVSSMSSPEAIRQLFDKRVTSRIYEEAQIPVPQRLDRVESAGDLAERMAAFAVTTVIVKVATSSSASCLAVVRLSDGGLTAMSTVETIGKVRFNSRKLVSYAREAAKDLVEFLLGEGAIVEVLVPKERIRRRGSQAPGQNYDLRVVVIDGEPAFVVGRASSHPITNLHLGGTRIAEEEIRASVAADRYERAMRDAVRAAACHDTLYVGLDVAFIARGGAHVVFEGNAFGDHLNDVLKDGATPHQWELRAFARRRSSTNPAAGDRSSTPPAKLR
ncbi:MAG: STM4014 family protein [Polyangiaceae bacterium]|nr:STM4014 family protein [Polyangiaceae bacterium]